MRTSTPRPAGDRRWIDEVCVPFTKSLHLLLERRAGARLDVFGQFRSAEHVNDLIHQVLGHDRYEGSVVDQVDDRPECAVGCDRGRDEHVGVDDDPVRKSTAHAVGRSARAAASSAFTRAIASSSEISSPVR